MRDRTRDRPQRPPRPKPQAEPEEVQIHELVLDPALQPRRDGVEEAKVREYADLMKRGRAFEAVKVALVDDVLLLVDGWHRVRAAESIGHVTVYAEVVATTRAEAVQRALEANTKHGIPLKPKDDKHRLKMLVKAGLHRTPTGGFKTYQQIAEALGGRRPPTTIRLWMKSLYPAIFAAMGRREDTPRYSGGLGRGGADWRRSRFQEVFDELGSLISVMGPEARWEAHEALASLTERMRAEGNMKAPPANGGEDANGDF